VAHSSLGIGIQPHEQNHATNSSTQPHSPAVESNINEEATSRLDAWIDDLQTTAEFIEALRTATLEQSNMCEKDIERLCEALSAFPEEMTDKHFIKALWCFLSMTNASQATYNRFKDACQACYPGDPFLSFDRMKHKVEMITGVVPLIHNMCIDTCAAFTGPFSSLQACPLCSEPQYYQGQETRVSNF